MNARYLLACTLCLVGACSSATSTGGSAQHAPEDDASEDAGAAGPADKLSWSYVYAAYFAPGTPGHCGQSGCHSAPRKGFVCASQAGCYASITSSNPSVGGKLVDPAVPTQSVLLDPNNSPLFWFNAAGGNMPQGALGANDMARNEIAAWVDAGASSR